MSTARQLLGRDGEDRAAAAYESAGFNIVERNWRVREGEIDLIAARAGVLVFCEVKTRSSDRFGSALESVDWRKCRQVRSVARLYLASAGSHRAPVVRFDVAAVTPQGVEIIEAAF